MLFRWLNEKQNKKKTVKEIEKKSQFKRNIEDTT